MVHGGGSVIPFIGHMDAVSARMETSRLTLRSLARHDGAILHPCITPRLTRLWIGWEPPATISETERIVHERIAAISQSRECHLLAFSRQDASRFVGCVFAEHMPRPHVECDYEIGVWIAEVHWGQGYATEMVLGFLTWLAGHTTLPTVLYSYTDGNIASQRLIERLLPDARPFVEHETKGGKVVDTYNTVISLDRYRQ